MSVPGPPGPPQSSWPAAPPQKPSTLGYWGVALAAMAVVLLGALLVVLLVRDDGDGGAADEFPLDESEGYLVLYEPAGDEGPQPFMSIEDREEATGTTTSTPPESVSSSVPEGGTTSLPEGAGGEVGLYGGSLEQTCNPELLIWFLERNADKAAAFAQALGIPVAAIPDFVRSLTPTVLTSDVRVTNHGFADGAATPRQTMLAAGTAVMIDQTGFPRIRCYCGNPLKEPKEPDTPCTCPPGTTTTSTSSTTTTTVPEDVTTTTTVAQTTTTTVAQTTTTTVAQTTTTRPPPPTTTTTRPPPPTTTTTTLPPPTTTTTVAQTTTTSPFTTPTPGAADIG